MHKENLVENVDLFKKYSHLSSHCSQASHLSAHMYRTNQQVPAMLDPLTSHERTKVSERIRRDITLAAGQLLKDEQSTKASLYTVHIKCLSLITLASCAIGYAMIYLQGVLVPFTLAIFFMFMLEPLLGLLLGLPFCLARICPRIKPVAERLQQERVQKKRRTMGQDTRIPRSESSDGELRKGSDRFTIDVISNSPTSHNTDMGGMGDMRDMGRCGSSTGQVFIIALSWRMWSLISVLFCLASLMGFVVFFIVLIVKSLNDFPWRKYEDSENLHLVVKWFPHIGADPQNLKLESILPWLLQNIFVDAVGTAFKVISMAFLTVLFLAFLLASDVDLIDDIDEFSITHKTRVSVRRYIRIKTYMALMVAVLIGLFFWLMDVDLAFLFAIMTFLLSYIPHVGYTVAVLAPLPVVFLDPTKTWGDLVIIFIVPFIIHQLASNFVEPKLLAQSLDLHPIVVLLALAFWSVLWGAVGAVLSVPLTAVLRLVLLEMNHPYTKPVVNLLKGRVGDSYDATQKPSSLTELVSKPRDVFSTKELGSMRSPNAAKKQKRKNQDCSKRDLSREGLGSACNLHSTVPSPDVSQRKHQLQASSMRGRVRMDVSLCPQPLQSYGDDVVVLFDGEAELG